MNIKAVECTIEHGMIRLPSFLNFPDGTKVLINIKPLLTRTQRRIAAKELAGVWKNDPMMTSIFEEIDVHRHADLGRNIDLYDIS